MNKQKKNPKFPKNLNELSTLSPSQVETRLAAILHRAFCPDVEELLNYQWGLLSQEQALQVAAHLAECSDCAQEASQLISPAFPSPKKPGTTLHTMIQAFIARLAPPGLTPAPIRSGAVNSESDSINVSDTSVYQVSELGWDIIIVGQWPESNATCSLQGQLLGASEKELVTLKVSLIQSKQNVATVNLKKSGIFEFSAIPAGLYTLCFYSEQITVSIPDIFLE